MRRAAMLVLALILLAAAWELYKLAAPDDGVRLGDALILPRSDDASMPHLARIFEVFGEQEVAGVADGGTVLASVVAAVGLRITADSLTGPLAARFPVTPPIIAVSPVARPCEGAVIWMGLALLA